MKRIIICEGKTDAILVSLFLITVHGWEYSREKNFPVLPVDTKHEVLNWYVRADRGGSEVAIWGAGGLTKVGEKLAEVGERTRATRLVDERFERVVLLIDRDTRSTEQCKTLISNWCVEAQLVVQEDLRFGEWFTASTQLQKSPAETHEMKLLPIVLPPDEEGCLEVFLANELRTSSKIDEIVVDGSRELVSKIPDEPYLPKSRFRSKAVIGAALSIISPDWVFGDVDEKLRAVEWDKMPGINAAYGELGSL